MWGYMKYTSSIKLEGDSIGFDWIFLVRLVFFFFFFWRQRSAEYIPKEGAAGKADFELLGL